MSIVSGTVGAILGSDAQNKATASARKSAKEANATNLRMFQESRGSTGSAVLPLYLQSKNGGLFENQLGQDLVDSYDAMHQDPNEALANYRGITNRLQPAEAGAIDTANSIFNGGVEKQLEDNFQPVAKARVATTRQGAIDALNKTLDQIDATRATQGFSGDSLANQLLKFKAQRQAGTDIGNATVQNLQDERDIKDNALNLKLSNLNLPGQMAQNDANFMNLPDDAYLDNLMKQQQPLQFLRIGTAQAPLVQPLNYSATPSAAQLALQGVSAAGNSALNYWLQNRQAQNYTNAAKSIGGTASGAGATTTTPVAWSAPAEGDPDIFGG